eukprot:GEMP01005738.1.p1 GENE.GEMP01005738.1~~GEMP01005738.1.p1  ORF type:complete len:939 (+),score=218.12 GEMP01005738.1:303-3119(+)
MATKCINCAYQCTGIITNYCCKMCAVYPGHHGRLCCKNEANVVMTVRPRNSETECTYASGTRLRNQDEPAVDKAMRKFAKGKPGVFISDFPDEIRDMLPKYRPTYRARRIKDIFVDSSSYVFVMDPGVKVVEQIPPEPNDEMGATYYELVAKLKETVEGVVWTFTRIQRSGEEDANYFRATAVTRLREYEAYAKTIRRACSIVVRQILDDVEESNHSSGEDALSDNVLAERRELLASLKDRDRPTAELFSRGIRNLMMGEGTNEYKLVLSLLNAALPLEAHMRMLISALRKDVVDARLYGAMVKAVANWRLNSADNVDKCMMACHHLQALEVEMSKYTREFTDAILADECLAEEPKKKVITILPNALPNNLDEDIRDITLERQVDALSSMDKNRHFNSTIAHVIKGSFNLKCHERECQERDPEYDATELMETFRELCAKCPDDMPTTPVESVLPDMAKLSATQCNVVKSAMQQRVTVVRGPPGTGKTFTGCSVIRGWLSQGFKTLAVAHTNQACEHIAAQLTDCGVSAVRLGASLSAQDLLDQSAFCELIGEENVELIREGMQNDSFKLRPYIKLAAERASVVVSSCIASGHPDMLHEFAFARVLFDEAGQITEPTALVPLWWGARAMCLIGDERQLPPTVMSTDPHSPLKRSLFERLIEDEIVTSESGTFFQLDIQHRMHPSLSEFPREHTYVNQVLDDAPEVKILPKIKGFSWRGNHRAVFINAAQGREEQGGTSYRNNGEAKIVQQVVEHAIKHGVRPEEIAVIAAYSAQVKLLRELFKSRHPRLKIATADSFQGSEKAMVIFCAVRTGSEVGFLRDVRRCNVIMTRAQRGLVVIGCRATFSREKTYWAPWLTHMSGKNACLDQWELPTFLESKAPRAASVASKTSNWSNWNDWSDWSDWSGGTVKDDSATSQQSPEWSGSEWSGFSSATKRRRR